MPNPATIREQRLRKTKAQLIDEIDTLERRDAAFEVGRDGYASGGGKPPSSDDYLASQALLDLAKFPSENPNPVLRVTPEGGLLYANDAAQAVKGLVTGRKKDRLPSKLAKLATKVSRTAAARQPEFRSGDHIFALALTPVGGESYINIYGRDITERKRAEEALRESERRFRSILKDSPIAVAAVRSSDREIIYANPRIYEMFRIDEQQLGTQGAKSYYVDDADRERMAELLKSDGFVHDEETRLKRGDGTEFWATVSFMDIDYAGEPGSLAWFYDITERKQAEEELAEKEAQLRVALDNMPGGMMLGDQDLNYVLFNGQYSELHDYPEGFLKVGMSLREEARFQVERGDYGPGKKDELVEQLLDLYQGGQATSWERTLPNGRTLRFNMAPTPEGGNATIATDITEIKQAEQAAAEAQALLNDAIDSISEGFALYDADDRLVLCNKTYRDLWGYSDTEAAPGVHWDDLDRLDVERGTVIGEGSGMAGSPWRIALSRRRQRQSIEIQFTDGRWVTIRDRKTAAGGSVSIQTDITELKRVEEALREQTKTVGLLHQTAFDANQAQDVEHALKGCLDSICAYTGWPVGHVYVRAPGELAKLVPSMVWHLDKPRRFANFRKVTEKATFESGVGLPGRVLETGEPAWIVDVTKDKNFPRAKLAKNIGVKAGFAIPVLTGSEVVAVLEFFSPEAVEPDEALLDVLNNIGGQVGRVIERKRAEEELARKEAQLRVALDNMPGGMMLGDQDLNYVLFNAQYSQLFDLPEGLIRVGGSVLDVLRYRAERGDFGPGDAGELIEQVVDRYRRGEANSLERNIPGGPTLQVDIAPTPEGGYVTIATDITERKRAEEALREAKRRSEEASKLVAEKNQMLESLSNQLAKYLSPQVYDSIFAGKQSVEIASKRKKLTVFFSDIADFAGTTDSLESEELTNLLNHYLTEMSKIALDHGATIDKYVGDAIIAFFGDPETRGVKEDARACVNMAIAMQRRMRELRSEWLDMGLEQPFQVRMGINTGFCTVGNFGSGDRMDYTIIGNEVNLAARLEALAEVGGILLAHETHSLVKATVMAEEGDAVTVKGFAKPVRTYS